MGVSFRFDFSIGVSLDYFAKGCSISSSLAGEAFAFAEAEDSVS
jgi:hypothetical protein